MSEILAVYADGGVIGRNPSPRGGTWAWLHVATESRVVDDPKPLIAACGAGIVRPERILDLPVTNNQTEYLALLRALHALPDGWSGPVYSDSAVTLGRFFAGWRHRQIPPRWEAAMREQVARLGTLRPVLLDGHPTRAQLAAGSGKRGNPVSDFNVLCDQRCGALAREFRTRESASG